MKTSTKILIGLGTFLLLILLTFGGLFVYWKYFLKPTPKKVLGEIEELKAAVMEPLNIYPKPFEETGEIVTAGLNSNIFESLVTLDNDFKLKPVLAESWSSPDEKTWRIYLKKNVKFHNGDEFSAEDVKATFDTSKKDKWISFQNPELINEIKVIDKHTVDLITKEPNPILLNKLTMNFILPKKLVESNDLEKHIGTGPFKLVSYEQNKEMVMERNENYWGEKPKVKKINSRFYFDEEKALEWFSKGEIDLIDALKPSEGSTALSKKAGIRSVPFDDYYVYDMIINLAPENSPYVEGGGNPFKDKRVREAIYRGINVEALIKESEYGLGKAQTQTIPKVTFGYNPNIKRLAYGPEKAKGLLKEAGYPNGFTFTLDIAPSRKSTGEAIAGQLKEIGITMKVKAMEDVAVGMDTMYKGDFSMFIIGEGSESGDASDVLDALAHSQGQDNFGKYSNPEVDALLENAQKTSDQTKRRKYLEEALEKFSNDMAVIPLFTNTFTYYTRDNIDLIWDRTGAMKGANIAGIKEEWEKPNFIQFIKNLIRI